MMSVLVWVFDRLFNLASSWPWHVALCLILAMAVVGTLVSLASAADHTHSSGLRRTFALLACGFMFSLATIVWLTATTTFEVIV